MRVAGALPIALLLGCGSKDSPPSDRSPLPPHAKVPAQKDDAPETPVPVPSEFPEGTRSLELIRTSAVRLEPGDGSKRIGTVAMDTRVGWSRTQKGAKGCQKSWVEIKPHGWICGDYVKPSTKPAFGKEVPFLDRGELVPGVYGKVTAPNQVTYVKHGVLGTITMKF